LVHVRERLGCGSSLENAFDLSGSQAGVLLQQERHNTGDVRRGL
jgi:hypothetical protein